MLTLIRSLQFTTHLRSLRSLHPNNKEGNTTVRARANQRYVLARSHFPTLGIGSLSSTCVPFLPNPRFSKCSLVNLGLSLNVLSY